MLVLLAILRLGGDAYGVTVLGELERRTARTLSTVYKTLIRLERKGYVRTRVAPPTPQRGGRRKKLYDVTAAGRRAARHSLSDLRQLVKDLEPDLQLP